ncbi:MAG: alpha-galactosidase [Lachnospiraceae bacterium]|nr:alpha-galactosidase [Lachnospiraceae bacterium]
MSIIYDAKENIFHLQTAHTSYVLGVLRGKYLLHLYYGGRISEYHNIEENLPVHAGCTWSATDIEEFNYCTDTLPMEYPCYGSADLRTPAFHAEYESGSALTCPEYVGHRIIKGKKPLPGLPATYVESEQEAETLEITLRDPLTGLELVLSYSVFAEYDVIAKSVRAVNKGSELINIKSILSSTTYLFDKNFEFVHLEGGWGRERHIQKKPLINGSMSVDSKRVSSSHYHSPFLALARPWTTENQGEVYGLSLVYSGNFIAQADTNHQDIVRVNMGINPFGFNWRLEPGEEFQAPEVILTYSDTGFGTMSRNYHRLYRNRLCRGKYRDQERPVLINNWEATYFHFNEEKILEIAKKAKSVGVELMVLDDGWFGKRNTDNCSLGDWTSNREKLPGGVEGLADKVSALGMKFGLWFEPEMVSKDSELYRKHPDWCIHAEGRKRTESRNQLVLDLTRKEVRDYIVEAVSNVLGSAPISYVKWDMNRNITEIGSAGLPGERQQELPHRYILGIYEVLERITAAFPDVLFEGCSGGGGRFDPGMLYYFPQYWTSDDSDAIERLYIQHGTSMVMPACTMGAHVSAVPNHQLHRTTPLKTRGHVAMMGQFGYELDLNSLSEEEIETVKAQISQYKAIRRTVHYGEMYRLCSPFEGRSTAWEYVSPEGNQVVLMYCTIRAMVLTGLTRIRFEGLEPEAQYKDTESGKVYGGDYLMKVGLYMADDRDFESRLIVLERLSAPTP